MRFVNITTNFIVAESILRCPIFLLDTQSKLRIVVFYAGYAIEEEKFEEVLHIVEKGGVVQISYDDIALFCEDTKCDKSLIIQENKFLFTMIETEENHKVKYSKLAENKLMLKIFFANDKLNFIELIKQVQAEVMCFPLSINEEVSITIQLVEELFTRDIFPVRCAVMAYSLAKLNKINSPETLCSVILAGLFKDLGLNQIMRSAAIEEDEAQDEMYLKHPMLTIYILSKASIDFSVLTKRLILEHHEKDNGEGFPRGKKEKSIHFLSHYLQVADVIIGLVEGRYNNQSYSWNKAFDIIINQREIPNLNTSFPNQLMELLESLKS